MLHNFPVAMTDWLYFGYSKKETEEVEDCISLASRE